MHITLVIPPFSQQTTYGGGVFNRGMLPSLGVGYLASYVRQHGHQVTFIDAPLYHYDVAATAKAIETTGADVVGISVLTKLAQSAYALAGLLKEHDPELPVIMGGAHITSFYEQIFKECPHVDYLIPGEGEQTLAELLDCLGSDGDPKTVAGIRMRGADGTVFATPPRTPLKDLDQLPHPVRDIYDNARYLPLPNQSRRLPATTVITSRGCPWGRCRFCYQGGLYASPYRRRSPENVIEEITALVDQMGVREIVFWDDNFCVNPKWIKRFCGLLDQSGLKLSWSAAGRVNTVSESMLKRMAASGCYNIYFGFESGVQETLDFVQKGITLEQSRLAVRWAKKAGMEIRGSIILGMPGDTPEKAEETIRFACELNVDWMIFYPYTMQPGTYLGDIAPEYGIVLEQQADMSVPSYVPKDYASADQIAQLLKKANWRYYARPRYFARTLWRIKNPYAIKATVLAFFYWLSLIMKRV